MHPEHAKPRDTRMISLGAFCEPGFTPEVPLEEHASLTFVVGPKHQFGYSKMSANQWGWWCHVAFAGDDQRAAFLSMPAAELAQRMLERYHGWCAPTGELIARSRVWVRTPIHDVPHLPTWHREHVVLIGDAAHAMSPAGGQGASLALEDAMLLGRLVADRARPLQQSFARLERLRRSRTEAMVARGYENDQRTLQELGAFGMWMRDTVLMPLFAPLIGRALTKVYAGEPALAA
jgi:2-polyprenyl-6-methoxyphenol hydroxylase-like FAD-dependent oxidoreductase